jgi:Tol biopolymer transport system component
MPLSSGTRLGVYEVISPIGAGGMGEVYRGRDTRLNRAVAIKVAADQFSGRFATEARAISALNHPHICTLYDVGPNYLVMELVEGDTLADRLRAGPLPPDLVIRYGVQIADALSAAHAKAITHRDLKPGNVMVAKSGVKVLDFGLAKVESPDTDTVTATRGIVGTLAYMAPEQLAGRACDARTDIFALGLILWEMATGQRPQAGRPPALPLDGVPERLAHVVERCLAPDPDDRWQSAGDVRRELEWAGRTAAPAAAPARSPIARLAPIAVGLLGLAGLVVAGLWIVQRAPAATPGRPAQFTLTLDGEPGLYSLSPDGRYLAFTLDESGTGASMLWIRALDSLATRRLEGTLGATVHVWSPDSQWIAFHTGGKLRKISPQGGPPQTIADIAGFQDGAWNRSGDIIYRPTNRAALFRVAETGGPSTPLTTLNESLTENSHRFPQFLPDGRRFLFVSRCGQRENNALYIGSLDSPDVTRVMTAQSQVRYLPPVYGHGGRLVFYRDGVLMTQGFNPDRIQLAGEPVSAIGDVDYNPTGLGAGFRTSADGRVMLVSTAGANNSQLVWFDRSGEKTGTLGPPAVYTQPRLSPDSTRVAFSMPDPQTGNRDLAYMETARGVAARLTTHVANDWFPVWSPDGDRLLFGSDRDGGPQGRTYLKDSLDVGGSEAALEVKVPSGPFDWSRDGRWILLVSNEDIWLLSDGGRGKPMAFLTTPFREDGGRFSPDGKWIAYVSNETGRDEVYVRPFTGAPAAASGRIGVSQNGGDFPVWGPGNRELFYMTRDSVIHAVDVRALGQAGSVLSDSRLFEACPEAAPATRAMSNNSYATPYDTRDGQRFLVNCRVQPAGRYLVLLDWLERK